MGSLYDGDPGNYPTSVELPDDSDAASAAALNTGPEAALDRTANINARVACAMASNFQVQAQISSVIDDFRFASWNALTRMWEVVFKLSTTMLVGACAGELEATELSWDAIGNAITSNRVYSYVGDSATAGHHYIVCEHTGDVSFGKLATDGGSWNFALTFSTALTDGTLKMFGSKIILACAGANAAASGIRYSTNQGTSFTDTQFSGAMGTVAGWIVEKNSNDTLILAIPRQEGAGGGSTGKYLYSTDGAAWISHTFDSSVVAVDSTPVGLAWTGTVWVLAVQTLTGGGDPQYTAFFTSLDGLSWTATGTAPHSAASNLIVSNLVAANGVLFATIDDHDVGTIATTRRRAIYSIDHGLTWRYGARLPRNGFSDTGAVGANCAASDSQFVMWNTYAIQFGHAAGYPVGTV